MKLAGTYLYNVIDSTNEEAKRLIDSGEIKGTSLVLACEQTSGKGTHGRKWVSPKGSGLYLTIVHLPKSNSFFKTSTFYTLACGIACVEAISEIYGITPSLKPVNDIYFKGKKLGGILVESKLYKEGIGALISGIGINLKTIIISEEALKVEPISLSEIINDDANKLKDQLIDKLVEKVDTWYQMIFNEDISMVEQTWEIYKI